MSLLGPPAAEVFGDLAERDVTDLLVASLRWWIDRTTPSPSDAADAPGAPGAEDAVLGACRAVVRHRTGRWLSTMAAGQQLLEDGRAQAFQRQVVHRLGG